MSGAAQRPPSASAADDDASAAQAYERLLVPHLFLPSARQALARADARPGERVVDVACGTGIGARLAAAGVGPSGEVVGVDHDAGMLAVASACRVEGAASRRWVCGRAQRLPFADRSFDLCLCLQGLQFLDDRPQGLLEMRRVLDRAGGRVVLTTWGALDDMPGHLAVYRALEEQGVDTASPRRGSRSTAPRRWRRCSRPPASSTSRSRRRAGRWRFRRHANS